VSTLFLDSTGLRGCSVRGGICSPGLDGSKVGGWGAASAYYCNFPGRGDLCLSFHWMRCAARVSAGRGFVNLVCWCFGLYGLTNLFFASAAEIFGFWRRVYGPSFGSVGVVRFFCITVQFLPGFLFLVFGYLSGYRVWRYLLL